jgi:hypothetical protein
MASPLEVRANLEGAMVQENCKVDDYVEFPGLELDEAAREAVLLLPTSQQEDGKFVALQSTKTTLKILQQGGVPAVLAIDPGVLLFKDQRGFDWYGPTLFVSAAMLTQNPNVVSVALSLIANYIHDLFAGKSNDGKVHLSVVVEESKGRKKKEIRYVGPVDGLEGVANVVKSTHERGE